MQTPGTSDDSPPPQPAQQEAAGSTQQFFPANKIEPGGKEIAAGTTGCAARWGVDSSLGHPPRQQARGRAARGAADSLAWLKPRLAPGHFLPRPRGSCQPRPPPPARPRILFWLTSGRTVKPSSSTSGQVWGRWHHMGPPCPARRPLLSWPGLCQHAGRLGQPRCPHPSALSPLPWLINSCGSGMGRADPPGPSPAGRATHQVGVRGLAAGRGRDGIRAVAPAGRGEGRAGGGWGGSGGLTQSRAPAPSCSAPGCGKLCCGSSSALQRVWGGGGAEGG